MVQNKIEPYLLSLLSSKIGSVSVQMLNTTVKSARSSVLALARDCSTAIFDYRGRMVAFPIGIPVHVGSASPGVQELLKEYEGDLRPGDVILNNSPYHGNTHAGDHTVFAPVFYDDEIMFIIMVKGHLADIGNSIPTTYHAWAKDVYEEGAIIFPHVRIQREYKNVEDIIKICKMRIRAPKTWYGDYLAMIGALRIGERELQAVLKKYGNSMVKDFFDDWYEYGKNYMVEQIKKLPAGKAHYETTYDPFPPALPDGLTVKVDLDVDPENGYINCDFTDNEDCKPCGLNLCEATVAAAARTGVLNHLSVKNFPYCEGSLSRVKVKMREGSIIGKIRHPYSASVATNNINNRVVVAVQCALNQITNDKDRGMAESGYGMSVGQSVISGVDSRNHSRSYVTQLLSGYPGGPGRKGHDGYMNFSIPMNGIHHNPSVEMVERDYPILFLENELVQDAVGAGEWEGGPSTKITFGAIKDSIEFSYVGDGHYNPSKGAAGGQDGPRAQAVLSRVKDDINTETVKTLPTINNITIKPGEAISGIYSCAGGYGDPLERDPDKVRHRVREGYISSEYAQNTYGVVLDTTPEMFSVDMIATQKLRARIKEQRNNKE
jgi:N-methylhydantoinase B